MSRNVDGIRLKGAGVGVAQSFPPLQTLRLFVLFFLPAAVTVTDTRGHCQAKPKPLSKDAVIYNKLLKGDVSPIRVADMARERGIDFQMTPETIGELRQAGADDDLVNVLQSLAPKAAPPDAEEPASAKPEGGECPCQERSGSTRRMVSSMSGFRLGLLRWATRQVTANAPTTRSPRIG